MKGFRLDLAAIGDLTEEAINPCPSPVLIHPKTSKRTSKKPKPDIVNLPPGYLVFYFF